MNSDDPNIHLIAIVSFLCDKKDVKTRVKDEVYNTWFNHISSSKTLESSEFTIDNETGEITI